MTNLSEEQADLQFQISIPEQNSWPVLRQKSQSITLFSIGKVIQLTTKEITWYIYYYLKAAGNNIKVSSIFNSAAFSCFWYFNDKMFFVITPITFTKLVLPQFKFPHHAPEFCSSFFFVNQLPVKSYQLYGFVTVCLIKCLPPKKVR